MDRRRLFEDNNLYGGSATVAPPVITSSTTFDVNEDTTAVGTVTATGQAPITFSITGGADAAKFQIVEATGVLSFIAAPDYENPTDADTNNVYVVQVTATNAAGSVNQTINVTVLDVAFVVTATDFDGSTHTNRGADLTGLSDGKTGTLIFAARIDGGNGTNRFLFNSTSNKFSLSLATSNLWSLLGRNAANTIILQLFSATAYTSGVSWRKNLISWDLANNIAYWYIGNSVDLNATQTKTNDTIDYTAGDIAIGATQAGATKFNGCLSYLYFHPVFTDLSVQANRRKWFDVNNHPVDIGANGSLALGVQPVIYLPNGDPTDNKGTGGNFTVTAGALAACSSSPSD